MSDSRIEITFEARPGVLDALVRLVPSHVVIDAPDDRDSGRRTILARVVEVKLEHDIAPGLPPVMTIVLERPA